MYNSAAKRLVQSVMSAVYHLSGRFRTLCHAHGRELLAFCVHRTVRQYTRPLCVIFYLFVYFQKCRKIQTTVTNHINH